jgi:hypothetical protein
MLLTGAGMKRHVHSGNHIAESCVSFIPLFGGTTLEPVLDLQSGDPPEVPSVVRDNDQAESQRLSRYECVERTDGAAALGQVRCHLRKPLGCAFIEGHDANVLDEAADRTPELLRPLALRPEAQLSQGN